MSFFGNLFKKQAQPMLQDAVFGLIEFQASYGFPVWSHTPSDVKDHLIIIDAPATGPTPLQHKFYTQLRSQLPARTAEARAFLATQADAPANLAALTLYSVEIGEDGEIEAGQFVLELSDAAATEIHRVEFNQSKPEAYSTDE